VFVPVRVLTDSGWLSGLYGKPTVRRLAEALNQGGETITITNVFVPGGSTDLPFFTCRLETVFLILPDEVEPPAKRASGMWVPTTRREVLALAGMATLAGRVEVAENLRVSDYFGKNRGFIEMYQTRLTVRDPRSGEQWTRDLPQILLNCSKLVGVSELAG